MSSSKQLSPKSPITTPASKLTSRKQAATKLQLDKSCRFSLKFENPTEPAEVNKLLVPLLKPRDVKQVVRKSTRLYHLIFKTVETAKEFRENSADKCTSPGNKCMVRWFGLPVKEVEIRRLHKSVTDDQIKASLSSFGRIVSIEQWEDPSLDEGMVNKRVVFEMESMMPKEILIDHTPGTVIYSKPLNPAAKRAERLSAIVEESMAEN